MRWQALKAQHGELRVIWKFLWLPLRINDEWRWMERSAIRQQYIIHVSCSEDGHNLGHWEDCCWVDEQNDTHDPGADQSANPEYTEPSISSERYKYLFRLAQLLSNSKVPFELRGPIS